MQRKYSLRRVTGKGGKKVDEVPPSGEEQGGGV